MKKRFQEYLTKGRFEQAKRVCLNLKESEIRDLLLETAYEMESITVYGFSLYMKEYNNEVFWTKLIFDLLVNPLCIVEGSYSLALFYARKLVSYKKSVENMERILFLYNLPENIVDDEEAMEVVLEILKIEPKNRIAMEILKKFN